MQLSLVLTAVVSQQLVPSVDGYMIPAFEVMTVTLAIRNLIRDGKIPQIDGVIHSSIMPFVVALILITSFVTPLLLHASYRKEVQHDTV